MGLRDVYLYWNRSEGMRRSGRKKRVSLLLKGRPLDPEREGSEETTRGKERHGWESQLKHRGLVQ